MHSSHIICIARSHWSFNIPEQRLSTGTHKAKLLLLLNYLMAKCGRAYVGRIESVYVSEPWTLFIVETMYMSID